MVATKSKQVIKQASEQEMQELHALLLEHVNVYGYLTIEKEFTYPQFDSDIIPIPETDYSLWNANPAAFMIRPSTKNVVSCHKLETNHEYRQFFAGNLAYLASPYWGNFWIFKTKSEKKAKFNITWNKQYPNPICSINYLYLENDLGQKCIVLSCAYYGSYDSPLSMRTIAEAISRFTGLSVYRIGEGDICVKIGYKAQIHKNGRISNRYEDVSHPSAYQDDNTKDIIYLDNFGSLGLLSGEYVLSQQVTNEFGLSIPSHYNSSGTCSFRAIDWEDDDNDDDDDNEEAEVPPVCIQCNHSDDTEETYMGTMCGNCVVELMDALSSINTTYNYADLSRSYYLVVIYDLDNNGNTIEYVDVVIYSELDQLYNNEDNDQLPYSIMPNCDSLVGTPTFNLCPNYIGDPRTSQLSFAYSLPLPNNNNE